MNFLSLIPLRNWLLIASHGVLIVIIGYFVVQSNMYKSSADNVVKELVKSQYNEAVHSANETKLVDELNKQNTAILALSMQQAESQKVSELQIKKSKSEAVTAKQKAADILRKRPKSSETACAEASILFEDTIYVK